MKKLLTICLTALITSVSYAQSFDKEKLDTYFNTLEKSDKFMGSVALSENGKIIYSRAIGYSDLENKTRSDRDTKYRIGSISKSFTAVLVFKAIESKKLTLETKLDQYYPEIENSAKITISDLLNHRSGIHNFTSDDNYLNYNTEKKSEAELLKIIKAGGSDFEPSSESEYSNSNYVLLSFILQRIYKKTYGQLISEMIIKPLELKNTFYGSNINAKNNEAFSYSFTNNWQKETETDMSIPLGAGAVVSTPTDLLKFADALFKGKLVSAKSLNLMKTITGKYGYGLFKIPFDGKTSYGHTGGIDKFSAAYSYFPAEKVGFALTSNGTDMNNNDISIAMLSAVFNKSYEIPDFKTFEVSASDLEQYLGTYSSKDIPLKITITIEDDQLMAQATGQGAFPLEATSKTEFKFTQAGIKLTFDGTAKAMILNQGGKTYNFKKE